MSEKKPPKHRRRQYIVDTRFQLGLAAQIVGVIIGIAGLYALALYVLPGGDGFEGMEPEEVRNILMRVNVIYVTLGTAILGVVAILLTHRVAGPVMVITNALKAMRKGDFTKRLALRERDFVKGLAGELKEFRDELTTTLADAQSCLDEGDVDGARELLAKLQPKAQVEQPKPEPEASATASSD